MRDKNLDLRDIIIRSVHISRQATFPRHKGGALLKWGDSGTCAMCHGKKPRGNEWASLLIIFREGV